MTSMATREDDATAEAAAWLARLQRDSLTEVDGLGFEAWLSASPGNAVAYRQALAVWQAFEVGAGDILANLATPARRPSPVLTRRWMVGAGGFAVAAGLALAVMPSLIAQSSVQTYATGKGERQHVTLTDGSVVDLNAETTLKVSFARSGRRVVLGEGEAIFDVAHEERRPFTVEAAGRAVRVVGTQFDVRNRQGALTVTVARGKLEGVRIGGHAVRVADGTLRV